MKEISFDHLYGKIVWKKTQFPFCGQIELTHRCNFNCIHCFFKGAAETLCCAQNKELTTEEWKKILDEIKKEGCLRLVFTGGEVLVRNDFLDIYSYAKKNGFAVVIFTNAYGFNKEIIDHLVKFPPHQIEITLNSINKATYEAITQVEGSFSSVRQKIYLLAKKKLPVVLKTDCLKQNMYEVAKIKKWSEKILGIAADGKYYYKYGTGIFPRFNGDKTPCDYRLTFDEMLETKKSDSDIWREYANSMHNDFPVLDRERSFLYQCNSWMTQFFINPYGRLKFCICSDKFSADIRTTSFREWFYGLPEKILAEKFKTNSPCRDCSLRPICYFCPARSFLETGSEEGPVEYYCQLAKGMFTEMQKAKTAKR